MLIPLAHEDAKTYTQATFKPLLNKLVKTPEYFNPHDLQLALEHIFTPGSIDPTQIGAFLTALHISRLERRPESLAIAASLLRSRAIPASVDHDEDFVVDIVGTGGDGHNTFNVSTTAAIVAAGAGARVIKVSTGEAHCKIICTLIHLRVAWQSSLDVVYGLSGPSRTSRLSLHPSDTGNYDSIPQNPLPIHPRTALPPLTGLYRAVPQTPPLPNDVQRPRAPDKPRQTERNGTRDLRAGARRYVCSELARRRSGKGVDRVWGREARRDQLRRSYSRMGTDQR